MKSFYECVGKNKFGLVQDGRSGRAANLFSPFGSIFTISDEYPGSGGGLWQRAFLRSSHRCGTCRRAAQILEKLCPDREIIPVYARDILTGGGNIHCITQQIPAGKRRNEQNR